MVVVVLVDGRTSRKPVSSGSAERGSKRGENATSENSWRVESSQKERTSFHSKKSDMKYGQAKKKKELVRFAGESQGRGFSLRVCGTACRALGNELS